ncbi:hypothetical protein SLEP1_g26607 [Rubroshorea leprosula]|uniref:Uncharacterized protein n=1 Tax=Rubroshorea leprosula TaxID=152421 RepID=A0AAV5K027_9ROSI|nr:hypothetical protein SLEP1_g26607 [Rubroshorea leprosula]
MDYDREEHNSQQTRGRNVVGSCHKRNLDTSEEDVPKQQEPKRGRPRLELTDEQKKKKHNDSCKNYRLKRNAELLRLQDIGKTLLEIFGTSNPEILKVELRRLQKFANEFQEEFGSSSPKSLKVHNKVNTKHTIWSKCIKPKAVDKPCKTIIRGRVYFCKGRWCVHPTKCQETNTLQEILSKLGVPEEVLEGIRKGTPWEELGKVWQASKDKFPAQKEILQDKMEEDLSDGDFFMSYIDDLASYFRQCRPRYYSPSAAMNEPIEQETAEFSSFQQTEIKQETMCEKFEVTKEALEPSPTMVQAFIPGDLVWGNATRSLLMHYPQTSIMSPSPLGGQVHPHLQPPVPGQPQAQPSSPGLLPNPPMPPFPSPRGVNDPADSGWGNAAGSLLMHYPQTSIMSPSPVGGQVHPHLQPPGTGQPQAQPSSSGLLPNPPMPPVPSPRGVNDPVDSGWGNAAGSLLMHYPQTPIMRPSPIGGQVHPHLQPPVPSQPQAQPPSSGLLPNPPMSPFPSPRGVNDPIDSGWGNATGSLLMHYPQTSIMSPSPVGGQVHPHLQPPVLGQPQSQPSSSGLLPNPPMPPFPSPRGVNDPVDSGWGNAAGSLLMHYPQTSIMSPSPVGGQVDHHLQPSVLGQPQAQPSSSGLLPNPPMPPFPSPRGVNDPVDSSWENAAGSLLMHYPQTSIISPSPVGGQVQHHLQPPVPGQPQAQPPSSSLLPNPPMPPFPSLRGVNDLVDSGWGNAAEPLLMHYPQTSIMSPSPIGGQVHPHLQPPVLGQPQAQPPSSGLLPNPPMPPFPSLRGVNDPIDSGWGNVAGSLLMHYPQTSIMSPSPIEGQVHPHLQPPVLGQPQAQPPSSGLLPNPPMPPFPSPRGVNDPVDSGQPQAQPLSSGFLPNPPMPLFPSPRAVNDLVAPMLGLPSPRMNGPLSPMPNIPSLGMNGPLPLPTDYPNFLSPDPILSPSTELPPMTPSFPFSHFSQSGIFGPGPQLPLSPSLVFPLSPSGFSPPTVV